MMNTNTALPLSPPLEAPAAPKQTPFQAVWRLFRKNRMAGIGLVIFIAFFGIALLGLALTSGQAPALDPSLIRLQEKLRPPLSKATLETLRPEEVPPFEYYFFGTDDLGRDVFARMLQGAWVSLTVGFVAVGISVLIGIFLGGIAGYYGQQSITIHHLLLSIFLLTGLGLSIATLPFQAAGAFLGCALLLFIRYRHSHSKKRPSRFQSFLASPTMTIDTFIMRLVDIMLCFPSFFLILTVVALLPASIYNIMIIIGLTSWMGTTRFVRAEFLSLRELDFVSAARALGVGNFRIIFRHIMPNAIAPVLVSATIGIAGAILTEAGLSFLGFGVPPPHATWGNILSDGKRFIFDAPWLTFIPGTAILVVVLAFNLFGEGLRDALNPRLRER
ncbi:MAG: ABC transporter permease [Desulfobacterales bacterium]|jgi:peptide/nickel transport system permease protein|nr:ABC transporter permease [Desulfobacterales bacterium]